MVSGVTAENTYANNAADSYIQASGCMLQTPQKTCSVGAASVWLNSFSLKSPHTPQQLSTRSRTKLGTVVKQHTEWR